jgi:hypothetical protein
MVQVCARCHRVNPRDAVYCYRDGNILAHHAGADIPADGSALNIGARPFSLPFVLPSGERCQNFLQLSLACQENPAVAQDVLHQGHLETFLAGQGRADLAAAARVAAHADDRERGLDDFLARLPVPLRPPQLQVEPAVVDLGNVRVGEERRFELALQNNGQRLLYGSAACAAPWLSLGAGAATRDCVFQLTARQALVVRVVGSCLRALDKPQEAQITLESNGGTSTVTVRVQVPVQPFPDGVLAGARSPRQLAQKAKEATKEAALLIENGAVARWYQANGWTYPVRGPAASGVAAVQQLFEALGLVKPPKVELSEDAIKLQGAVGQKVEYVLTALTQENRAVVAHGSSDQTWLSVGPTVFRGRSAFLPLTIAAVPGSAGASLQAVISVTANGNQRFTVPVTLAVLAAAPSPPRPPSAAAKPSPPPVPTPAATVAKPAAAQGVSRAPPPADAVRRGAPWLTVLPALLLVVTVLGAALRDYLAPVPQAGVELIHAEVLDPVPRIEIRFHDEKRNDELEKLWLTSPHPTMRFGVVLLRKGQPAGEGVNLTRLTFDPWGRTNNTCVRFDGSDERLYGGEAGSWEERAVKSWKDEQGHDHEGTRSIWVCDDKRIRIAQFVELVRGAQSRLLDTCRVRYRIENLKDGLERKVGLRFLLDTFIGGNDGVPFTIPGASDLCDTKKDLPREAKDKKLPDFLQALEKPDLAHPGTIAHLRLNLENLEPPARVTLGAWPNEKLRVLERKAAGPSTLWDVPLLPLKSLELNDSAVALYWQEQLLKPGAQREVGFEFGPWNLARQGGRLAATVDGAFRPDGELTVIAYVKRSDDDASETVTLSVPAGFKLVTGARRQDVPSLPTGVRSGNVPLTWKIQAGPTGRYDLRVTSSTGAAQTLPVEIRKSIF